MQEAIYKQGCGAVSGVVFAAVTLLLIVNSGTDLSIWIALLLRPFMHGVSLFKTNFLLAFLLLIALGELFRRSTPSHRAVTALLRITLGAASLASLIAMTIFLQLTSQLHLPVDKYAYFFRDGFVSINQFAHLHVTKTGLYHLVNSLGMGEIANHADTGLPFASLINPYMAVALLVLSAITLVALIMAAPAVIRCWNGGSRALALVLYALAGSHTVKCLLDGGPLSYDFLPSVLVISLLFLHARGRRLQDLIARDWSRYLVATLISIMIVGLFSLDVALVLQPQQYLFFFGIYALMIVMLIRPRISRFFPRVSVALVILWCLIYYHQQTTPDLVALYRHLDPSDKVSLLSGNSVDEAGALEIRDMSVPSSGERVIDVYRANGQRPLRNRALLIKTGESEHYGGFLFAIRIIRADSLLAFPPSQYLTIHGIAPAGNTTDSLYSFRVEFARQFFPSLWSESADILNENNKFAAMFYLDRYLRQHGLHEYVLVPLFYEETA